MKKKTETATFGPFHVKNKPQFLTDGHHNLIGDTYSFYSKDYTIDELLGYLSDCIKWHKERNIITAVYLDFFSEKNYALNIWSTSTADMDCSMAQIQYVPLDIVNYIYASGFELALERTLADKVKNAIKIEAAYERLSDELKLKFMIENDL